MALEFNNLTQLKNYVISNFPDVIEIINENIFNSHELKDNNSKFVTKQIAYSVQSGDDSDESKVLKVTYEERKSDNFIRVRSISQLKTPALTYSERIYNKIGTVIGSETLVGLIINEVDETAETALVKCYWDNAGSVQEKFHLVYGVPITLKTKGNGDLYT